MSSNTENDMVHLQAGEHLPAVPVSSPTTEMLKQLLEQMLENERRRLRNEYVRISMLFLLLLAVAIGGGLWFAHSLMDQLRAERQSLYAMLQPDAETRDQRALRSLGEAGRAEVRDQRAEDRDQHENPEIENRKSEIENSSSRADTNTVQAQADIKQILSDLESKKQTLTDLLKSQNAQTKNMLKSRDAELQILHERMQEIQRKVMNAAPPEAHPAKKTETPPAIESEPVDSLTVTTTNSVKLRLPIPSP